MKVSRRSFMKHTAMGLTVLSTGCYVFKQKPKPNILFCMADDWGWPHAGILADPVVQTPTFDRLAREGVLLEQTYVSSPSCTPSRNAFLTGQYHWRLGEGANLHSTLDVKIPVFPLLLEEAGYVIGHFRKCWGPGKLEAGGYGAKHPAGPSFTGFREFLDQRPEGRPFFFWFGSSDPHRPYEKGSGKASGMDISKVPVPGFYPDAEEIRSDIADYYFEVQRFDRECGDAIRMLEETGELDNTIIVMTGDNGMPFPRCKSNLYDMGVRVPMAIRWGDEIRGDRRIGDFVSLTDMAPTFLEIAGVSVPPGMTGKSILPLLKSREEVNDVTSRNEVVFGKERHVPAQAVPSMDGYPCRAIRTQQFLYITNFAPERWPAGVPEGSTHPMNHFADCDDGPTKEYIMQRAVDDTYRKYYEWCFGKRPGEELYDMEKDPDQLTNLADHPAFEQIRSTLRNRLINILKKTNDPRVVGGGDKFDQFPYRTDYSLNTGTIKK